MTFQEELDKMWEEFGLENWSNKSEANAAITKLVEGMLNHISDKNDEGLFIDPHKKAVTLVLEHRRGVQSAIESERKRLHEGSGDAKYNKASN